MKFEFCQTIRDCAPFPQKQSPILLPKMKNVTSQALISVSSCKPGFGVKQLLDPSIDTFYQSDGPQPHQIDIEFKRRTQVSRIELYLDYLQDESYTPKRIVTKVGASPQSLHLVEMIDVVEPRGWIALPIQTTSFYFRVEILTNYQNGKDSHIRSMRIISDQDALEP